jgi:hypothetical protein
MFKKILLIISIALGLIISGCASFDYETRPFFNSTKIDCGNGHFALTQRLCSFERWGY